ncbi:MAG: internal scaffolding protein [Microvirus sp.]|nr:MAG: internal scaffolding protein [Microvirus sp.]
MSKKPIAFLDVNDVMEICRKDENGIPLQDFEAGKCITQQHFKDECDVNQIVERFMKTGELPENQRIPQFGDFSDVKSYDTALQLVRDAQEEFENLPALIRKRFNNNPEELLEFIDDPSNQEEGIRLGLMIAKASKDGLPPVDNSIENAKNAPPIVSKEAPADSPPKSGVPQ